MACLIEASPRSASLDTVRIAERLGRRVFAAPGGLYSFQSGGCHALLGDGTAECLTGPHDIVNALHDAAE